MEIIDRPLFSDQYLERQYGGKRVLAASLNAYGTRIRDLVLQRSPDLIWLEKEALPWLPWALERGLLPAGVPIVADYDDAVFHNYDLHKSQIVRRLLGRKIDSVMRLSALTIVGNDYLAARAQFAGARNVQIVPTVVDATAYVPKHAQVRGTQKIVGWIGTPSTWHAYVSPLLRVLTNAAAAHDAVFMTVGTGDESPSFANQVNLPWAESTEVSLIQSMDVGVMPLENTPWALGKCGYKLIQYMACGVPVIASPIGINSQIVEHGINGFLASNNREWRESLDILLGNDELRIRMGQAGREKAEREYSLHVWAPRVGQMMQDLVRRESATH